MVKIYINGETKAIATFRHLEDAYEWAEKKSRGSSIIYRVISATSQRGYFRGEVIPS
jgi:hypothetical protein